MKKMLIGLLTLIMCVKLSAQVVIKSNASPTLTDKGMFGKSEKIAEVILPALTEEEIMRPIPNILNKSADSKNVDISPLLQASSEVIGDNIIYRQRIIGTDAKSIKVHFDRLILSKNAQLYIYTPSGSVVAGPITASENIGKDRIWGSNAFPGSTVIIELLVPANEKFENDLHISKLFLGFNPKKSIFNPADSLNFGHYEMSSICVGNYPNTNVMCPAAAAYENERKAVCMIELGYGSGSGFLVSNTCNTNIPYLLTAQHVTNAMDPNNCQYIFGWWSPLCTNYYTQTALLFNGAALKASDDQTDFALLELYQTPPANADMSYLGWSRSTTPPSTSVGIHHPAGDQMKIAFATTPAYLGNILTYTNTGWRLLWATGGVEGGSSGSPLLDPNKRAVGQLYSGTQPVNPPCNQQIGGSNYGRFDLSWTGRGTNTTRLSNWLDPSNSGAMTTNTTHVSQFTVTVTGPAGICLPATSANYNINNLPTCGTNLVTWSTNVPQVTVSPLTGNTTTMYANGYIGPVTLTATVSGSVSIIVNKQVYIGTVPSCSTRTAYMYVNGWPQVINKCAALTQIRTINQNQNILANTEYYANVWVVDPTAVNCPNSPSIPCIRWEFVSSSGYASYTTNGSQLEVVINTNSPNGWIRMKCITENGCGSYAWDFWFTPIGSTASCPVYFDPNCLVMDPLVEITKANQEKVLLNPNPTHGQFTVSLKNTDKDAFIKTVRIKNKMGIIVYQQNFKNTLKEQIINLFNQPTDMYLIEVFDGKKWLTEKLSLQR